MNALDIGLMVLAGFLFVLGLMKGFVRLLVMILALVVAFALASRFHEAVAGHLSLLRAPVEVLRLLAYLVIFLGAMLAGGLIGWLLRNLVKAAMLGWADRLAGAAVGVVAALLLGALLVLPMVAYSPHGTRLLEGSRLAPYVAPVADLVNLACPDGLAARYEKGIEGLRRMWRGEGKESPAAAPDEAKGKPSPPAPRSAAKR